MTYPRPRASDLTYEEFLAVYPRIAGGDGEGDPAPAAVPPTPAPAELGDPLPGTPAPVNPGPWTSDLEQYFADQAAREAADRYMRERVQPRITKLEQDTAPARQLYQDLLEDPGSTLQAVLSEVYGDEVAAGFVKLLEDDEDPDPGEPQPNPAEAAAAAGLPEHLVNWLQQQYDQSQASQQEQAFAEAFTTYQSQQPDLQGLTKEQFAPFVVAAEGDFDAALEGYRQFRASFQPAAPTPAAEPAAPAPPVLGSSATGSGAGTPPQQKQYASLDDALDDFLAEQRAPKAPPTVGSV